MESSKIKRLISCGYVQAVLFMSACGSIGLLAAGCTKTGPEPRKNTGPVPGTADGEKVQVIFKTYVAYPDTKASENTVENIVISVYNDGKLVENINPDTGESAGMSLVVGKTYTYYASANIARDEIPETETAIRTARTGVKAAAPSGGFPMTAHGSFTVSGENTAVDVMLERLYSKIRFSVDRSDVPDLKIVSVNIRQAATSVAMFSESKAVATSGGDSASQSEISALNSGAEIVLYLPENCQGVLLPGNSDSWAKIPDNISGKSDLCSYLEVTGEFTGEQELNGSITYRFYLGQDETSDFNVIRNTDNAVTLIPSRDAITRPSWKVDGGNVYAVVPIIMMGKNQVLYKTKTVRRVIFTDGNGTWEKVIRGGGKYVAIGNGLAGSGYIGYSTDGLSWETESFDGEFTDISYGDGTFIALSDNGTYISGNGRIWDSVYPEETLEFVAYGNGKFVALSDNGAVYSSRNGSDWTYERVSAIFPTLFEYGNGEFVCISQTNNVMKSSDGHTWTSGKYTFDQNLTGAMTELVCGNGKYIMSTGGGVYCSENALDWKKTDLPTAGRYDFALDYKDGVFVCGYSWTDPGVRIGSAFATSLDGMHWTEVETDPQTLNPRTICIMN